MPELFIAMMKEEWRLHSALFGSVSFALFPVLIGAISFMSAFLLPLIRETLPVGSVLSVTVAMFTSRTGCAEPASQGAGYLTTRGGANGRRRIPSC